MIIYGYKHFLDAEAYRNRPVQELARLYRLVRQLVDYLAAKEDLPQLLQRLSEKEHALTAQRAAAVPPAGQKADKKLREAVQKLEASVRAAVEEVDSAEKKIAAVDDDPLLAELAADHGEIGRGAQAETAKLHAGDAENLGLWREFMPYCVEDVERIYRRLEVRFDHTLGESFYHAMLPGVVEELRRRGIAQESQGAVCVFLEGQPVPMIVQKQDGAYLYATTDLATIRYRMNEWRPDAILYVVDHRQSLHFQQLFAAAQRLGCDNVELQHISFGTVLGKDGRPFKTRAGDTVGLEGLLDEAVFRAARIVAENDDAKPDGPELSPEQRACVAETVGIGALKYADLSQNRTSDYEFDYEKMLAMNGNTATYMQYAYARVRNIFARGDIDIEQLRNSSAAITLGSPAERALALELLRFGDAVTLAMTDYRPNQLTAYLFDLANCFSTFYEKCSVLKAETPQLRDSRLLLCDLTARTIQKGLELLGIGVEEKM
jgi:arginyl-tRNA synthetase